MRRRSAEWVAIVVAVTGCSSILPKAPARTYYDLDYAPVPVHCNRSYSAPVEVWSFSAAAPYDRAQMVVTDGREVSLSRGHEWVARPGVLVAETLMRDLGAGGLFTVAVSPRDPQGARLELTGNVYQFAWEKDDSRSARARLEANVILRRTGDHPEILMHRRYDLKSEPAAAADDASTFARAMSEVVARFSSLVRQDLCAALEPPTGASKGLRHNATAGMD